MVADPLGLGLVGGSARPPPGTTLNCTRKLARVIVLDDGTRLRKLSEARTLDVAAEMVRRRQARD